MNCYNLKLLNFNEGLLDSSIDATYIIHLEGNGRLNHIYNMLNEYQPSKIVYIVFNKGYKKCNKGEYINSPSLDLIDTYLNIFKDAQFKNYNNILILEDDFTFLPEIKNKEIIYNINDFIESHKDEEFVYYLGCIPFLRIPNINHSFAIFTGGSHACIYSNKFIENINKKIIDTKDWDTYLNFNYINKRYMNNKLLCYQLFPETENSKEWGNQNYIFSFVCRLTFKLFKLLKLDKQHDIGYPFFYTLSLINFIIIIVLILLFIRIVIPNKKIVNTE